jgi:alpha-1,3-rhamnosyl/mannosyltransferase
LWVDALQPQLSGIGRYTWELCRGLRGHAGIKRLHYFSRGQLIGDPAKLLESDAPRRRRLPWRRLQDAAHRRTIRNSLFHGPNYFLPDFVEGGAITVHDLSVFRFPETHPAERIAQFEQSFGSALKRARHIITDTETVRQEVLKMFGLRPAQVSAVHLGVNPTFRPRNHPELAATLRKWNLQPGAYGLCVSTLEPRKKIIELIAAWRRLPRPLRDRFPLVLAGGAGWLNDDLHLAAGLGSAEGWLHHIGFVGEEDLPSLYAGAGLFIYPSIYEGFGLPPLEAMASGVPVIVAARSCLPEVCGPAALYMDPDDDDDFLAALTRGLEDETWRAQAISAGLARAASFSWKRCMEDTVEAYRIAAAGA